MMQLSFSAMDHTNLEVFNLQLAIRVVPAQGATIFSLLDVLLRDRLLTAFVPNSILKT